MPNFAGGGLGMGVIFNLTGNFRREADMAAASMTKLEGTVTAATQKISASLNRMKMGLMGLALSAAILLPFAAAVNTSMEFSAVMSDVGAKANATTYELSQLRDEAIKLGEATVFSAKEAAEGQAFLAMAGFKTNQIIEAMPGMLDLAASGSINLAQAADIASNVLTQFNLAASQSTRIADVMAKTITTSNTNMTEMADAMNYLGPTAASMGIQLEEASAMVGLMANSGLKGSLATRALSTSLVRLAQPTKEMSMLLAGLEKRGFKAFTDQGEFVGMASMLEGLEKSMEGFTQKQKLNTIATLFGKEAIQEFSILLSAKKEVMRDGTKVVLQGSEALKEYTQELENAGGTAERIAREKLNNLKGDWTILTSVIETGMIKLGGAVEPILRVLTKGFTLLAQAISWLISTPIGQFFSMILFSIGLLIAGLSLYVIAVNAASFATGMLGKTFAQAGKQGIALAFINGGLTAGFWALATAVWTALAPLLPFIAAGVAIVALFFGIKAAMDKGVEAFQRFQQTGEKLKGIGLLFQRIGGVIAGVKEIWNSWNGSRFTLGEKTKEDLDKLGILDFVLKLGTWVIRIKEFMGGIFEGFSSQVDVLREAFSPIGDVFNQLIDAISPLVFALFPKLKGEASGFATVGKMIGKVIAFFILRPLLTLAYVIKGVIWVWNLLRDGIKAMPSVVGSAIGKIVGWFENMWGFVTGLKERLFNLGVDLLVSLKDGIVSSLINVKEFLADKLSVLGPLNPFQVEVGGVEAPQNRVKPHSIVEDIGNNMSQNNTAGRFQNNEPTVIKQKTVEYRDLYVTSKVDSREVSKETMKLDKLNSARKG